MNKKIILSILASSILVAQEVQLKQITVTSPSNTTQSIKDVTSNINVITAQEIEEKHYTTVTDALNSIPGISFSSNGGLGQSTKVQLRGMESKRVLVLIDGIRYNNPTDAINGSSFSHLMINDIEQIEVVKGAQSGIWGADATAGVINIITKSAKKGVHGSIFGEYGSFNTKKYGASASYKSDDYYVKINSAKISNDGFTAKAPKGDDIDMYEDDGYVNLSSSIKFGVNIDDKNRFDISHTIIDIKNQYDSTGPDDTAASSISKEQFTQINFNHINSFNELDIYAKKADFDREYSNASSYTGETYEYGVKSNIRYGDKDFLLIGLDYKSFETKDYYKTSIDEKFDSKAVFATNSNFFYDDKVVLTESIRGDIHSDFEDKVTGKLGLRYNYNNDLFVSSNIGTAYNTPTASQLYSKETYLPVDPESTTSYDFSLGYKDLKLTYFYSKIEEMIVYVNSTLGYENLNGTSKIQGLEAEYSLAITDELLTSVSYTRLDAKNSDDEVLKRRPKDSLKFNVDYYATKTLHIGINGEYVGERYDSDDEQGEQTGKYAVVNCVINYEINKNFSAYTKIDNLFDKEYQVVDGYATAPLSAYVGIKAQF